MKHILLLDDNVDSLDVLKWSLQRSGYTCSTTYYRQGLFYSLSKSKAQPSLIIMDVNLGADDGREICYKIKSGEETKYIPVMLCSGNDEMLINFKSFLADDIIHKPFNMPEMMEKISRLVSLEQKRS